MKKLIKNIMFAYNGWRTRKEFYLYWPSEDAYCRLPDESIYFHLSSKYNIDPFRIQVVEVYKRSENGEWSFIGYRHWPSILEFRKEGLKEIKK